MYISHLDLLRTFQRVFLRQGIVLRHSQGFHPHPILSFALPLSVGQESVCELLDLETVEDLDCAALPGRLAPSLPCVPPSRSRLGTELHPLDLGTLALMRPILSRRFFQLTMFGKERILSF